MSLSLFWSGSEGICSLDKMLFAEMLTVPGNKSRSNTEEHIIRIHYAEKSFTLHRDYDYTQCFKRYTDLQIQLTQITSLQTKPVILHNDND